MRLLTFSLFALFLAGCAGYHVGPVKPKVMKDISTLAIPNFKNDTVVPRIEVLVAGTIVKQIQQDGTYKIAHENNADAIMEGRITEIRRTPARSVHGDVLSTREFKLTVRLEYKVHSRATGEMLMHRNVTGATSFFVGGDVNQDERQAIPLAVERAAVSIASQLSEGW
jgi:hypothetical protein